MDGRFSPDISDAVEVMLSVRQQRTPERRLVRALLTDAFNLAFKAPNSAFARQRVEARTWFSSDDDNHPFSFLSICRILQLEPAYVRRLIAERDQRTAAPISTTPVRRIA